VTLEKSHGKARPTLPRASDLPEIDPTELEEKLSIPRGVHGHVLPGAKLAVGARFAHTVKKSMGGQTTKVNRIITRDAKQTFANILPVMASDVAPVRSLLAVASRHCALNAYFTARAEEAGLDSTLGLQYLEIADRQSQRYERVLVTCHDLARIHAQVRDNKPFDPVPKLAAPAAEERPTTIDMVEEGGE